jgi:hypothetical protein
METAAAPQNTQKSGVDTRWQPGQSGNPGGRPKVLGAFRERLREHADKAVQTLVDALDDENSRVRVAAAAELLDRAYGKAPQSLTNESGEGPLELVIRWQR